MPGSPAAGGRQCRIVLPRQRIQAGPLLFQAILYHSDIFSPSVMFEEQKAEISIWVTKAVSVRKLQIDGSGETKHRVGFV